MTLNFFSNHEQSDGKRYKAVNTVSIYIMGRRHFPRDFVEALHFLIPELGTLPREEDYPEN